VVDAEEVMVMSVGGDDLLDRRSEEMEDLGQCRR